MFLVYSVSLWSYDRASSDSVSFPENDLVQQQVEWWVKQSIACQQTKKLLPVTGRLSRDNFSPETLTLAF